MSEYKQHHMDKEELKANKLLDWALALRHATITHAKAIGRAALVAVLLAVLLTVYLLNRAAREDRAALQFENAYSSLRGAELGSRVAEVEQQLAQVVSEFPGTFAAAKANYYLGDLAYNAHRTWDKAIEHFQKTADYGRNSYMYPAALLGIGNANEQKKEYAKAIEAYDVLLANDPDSGFGGSAKLGKARCLVALNKVIEAKTLLEALVREQGALSKEAEKWNAYLEVLVRKNTR